MKRFEEDYRHAIAKSSVRGLGNPQVKKELQDRIQRLADNLEQAQDEEEQHEIQFLLDRARGDYQKYLAEEGKMVAMIREDRRVREERERQIKRQRYQITAIVAVVGIVLFFVVGHIIANRRGAAKEAAAKAAFQHKDANSQKESQASQDNKLEEGELVPKNLVGTWTGTQGGVEMTLIFTEDGSVTIRTDTADGSYTESQGTIITSESVDDNTFKIVGYEGFVSPSQLDAQVQSGEVGYQLGKGGKTLYGVHWPVAQASYTDDYGESQTESSTSDGASDYEVDKENVFVKSED